MDYAAEGPGGFVVTIVLRMAGASVGSFVVSVLGRSGTTGFNIWSILVATLGAVILLFLYGLLSGRPVKTKKRRATEQPRRRMPIGDAERKIGWSG